jgi:hypothetical protein
MRIWLKGLALAAIIALSFAAAGIERASAQGGGHWNITVTPDGDTHLTGPVVTIEDWEWDDDCGYMPIDFFPNTSASCNGSGTQNVRAVWVNAMGQPSPLTAPSVQVFKVTSVASWTVSLWEGWGFGLVSHSASNGLGDPEILDEGGGASSGIHLLRKTVTNGVVEFSISQSASISASSYEGSAGLVAISHVLEVVPDPRKVALSRAGARADWMDADGNMHGDTTYSWNRYLLMEPPTTEPHVNWQVFTASLIGDFDWSQDVSTQWVPDCSQNTPFEGHWSMIFGTLYQSEPSTDWLGGPGQPTERSLLFTATDNLDGAKASVTYNLTIHEPLERNYPDAVTQVTENLQPAPGWVWCLNRLDGPGPTTVEVTVTQGSQWSIGVGLNGSIAKWVAWTLGIDVNAQYSRYIEAHATVVAPNVEPGFATRMMRFDVFEYHNGIVDEYDPAGKVGTPAYQIKKPNGWGITYETPYTWLGI